MTPRDLPSAPPGLPGTPGQGQAGPGHSSVSAEIDDLPTDAPAPDDLRTASPAGDEQHGADHSDGAGTDRALPVLLGYVCKPLLRTESEFLRTKAQLARFAAQEGFALRSVFAEEGPTSPAAFEALVEAASDREVTAVVVPSMTHLTVLSAPTALKNRFEHLTGARLLVGEV